MNESTSEPAPRRESLRAEDIMTVREVADFLKVSPQSVYSYAKNGTLRSRKLGSHLVFLRPQLEDFLWGETTD
jgi:excisionase family DNA binding protein